MLWNSLILGIFTLTFLSVECLMWEEDTENEFCVNKPHTRCPDRDIKFFLYSSDFPVKRIVNVRHDYPLVKYGWNPHKKNVIIIHGFNGTENKTPMTLIVQAYLRRRDYNVFTVDWAPLTFFPCYLASVSNSRLVGQCTAQFYSHLTYNGASAFDIHCVGHSLGAHICGMISKHLSHKIHKIVGLDPARPLVDRYGNDKFRLTKDDANVVQVIHTNAGVLGEWPQIGHIDFCVNGGTMQPSCRNEPQIIRQNRCSHFKSVCFFAATVPEHGRKYRGLPCTKSCRLLPGFKGWKGVSMGEHTPDDARGVFCLRADDSGSCPFV